MKRTILPVLLLSVLAGCDSDDSDEASRKARLEDLAKGEKAVEEGTREITPRLEKCLEIQEQFRKQVKEPSSKPVDLKGVQLVSRYTHLPEWNTHLVMPGEEPFKQFPEKYKVLAGWGMETPLSELWKNLETLRESVEAGGVMSSDLWLYDRFFTSLKAFQYVALLEGTYQDGIVLTDPDTGEPACTSGKFTGACHLFRVEDAKYLGRVMVSAKNKDEILYTEDESLAGELKRDLREQTREAAWNAIEKKGP